MIFNGCFLPAKKVALALNALIRGQFPRDSLYIVGFSLYARVHRGPAPAPGPGEWSVAPTCTRLPPSRASSWARHKGGNKQVIA
jgi:hypothetical protein